MPAMMLKKMVMGGFDKRMVEPKIANSIDFMVDSVRNFVILGFVSVQSDFVVGMISIQVNFEVEPCHGCIFQLDSLGQKELASRLTLNCVNAYVAPQKLKALPITIVDVRSPLFVLRCSTQNSIA